LGGNPRTEGCEEKADGVDEAGVGCVLKAEIGWVEENGDEELLEKALFAALPPGPKTDPAFAGALVDALPPGPNTDPVGLALADTLPPGPKTDPVGFGVENGDPPNAESVDGCCVPNAEGCPKADAVVLCAGVPKADGVMVGVLPKDD
jgi:hypothetical protein